MKDIAFANGANTLLLLLDDGSGVSSEPKEYKYNYIYLHNEDAREIEIDVQEYLDLCGSGADAKSTSYEWSNSGVSLGSSFELLGARVSYDVSSGKIVIEKSGPYTEGDYGYVDSKELTLETSRGVVKLYFTIYVNPQGGLDETRKTGSEQYVS